ncbi:MAG TPA: response regulator [bacterium]|nr:response regulator [bacterium]
MFKVLIVDDAKLMRNIIKNTILENFKNVNVIEAKDGMEAIDIYRSEKPDLVTMDITMEQKNGVDSAKEIYKINKKAKIVMVTSLGQEKILQECLKMGVSDYIVKPFTKERIVTMLSNSLNVRRSKESRQIQLDERNS